MVLMWLGPSATTLFVAGRSLLTTVTVLLLLLAVFVLPLTGLARRPPEGPRRVPVVARRVAVAARSVTALVSVAVLAARSVVAAGVVVSTARSVPTGVAVSTARSVTAGAVVSTAFVAAVLVVSVVKANVATGAAWSVVTSFVVAITAVGS